MSTLKWFLLAPVLVWSGGLAPQGFQVPKPVRLVPFSSARDLASYFKRIAVERERARLDAEARAGCPTRIKGSRKKSRLPTTVIVGRLLSNSGRPIEGGQLSAPALNLATITGKDGGYRLVIPADRPPERKKLVLMARAIGYRSVRDSFTVSPGDSIEANVKLCVDVLRLEEVISTAVAATVTNNQESGVDEGGIVKLYQNMLVILRRGRLFTVAIEAQRLRPIAAVNAYGPGLDPRNTWYDELVVYGDKVVVIGYSYQRGGTELTVFRIAPSGSLEYQDTYQLRSDDYYSSRNYASRLIGSHLVFYTPFFLQPRSPEALPVLPALRKWGSAKERGEFEDLVSPQAVYRSNQKLSPSDYVLHTVTSCDLAARELNCEARAVLGGPEHSFYVSPNAVYVWTTQGRPGATLVRFPLDGSRPGALGVQGMPLDQFSFLEGADGWLNVLVLETGRGEGMWGAERSRGSLALLRLPLQTFDNDSRAARRTEYRSLPSDDGILHNRFAATHLLYGTGNGWGPARRDMAALVAVPLAGGPPIRIPLSHGADRIELMGGDALVVGVSGKDLFFTGIALGPRPEPVQRYILTGASQGEVRSHGFFYRADGNADGILGLPFRKPGRPGYEHLFEGSAGVVFLENRDRRFKELGLLEAGTETRRGDRCEASCVDWYGNARPLFVGERVFALLGYEVVEGVVRDGRITEIRRVGFQP